MKKFVPLLMVWALAARADLCELGVRLQGARIDPIQTMAKIATLDELAVLLRREHDRRRQRRRQQ